MPTYSYACTECDNKFDIVQSFSDDSLTQCPECSGRLRKLFNSVGIVFKGSGFYRTDSRPSSGGSKSEKSDSSGSGSSSESSASKSSNSAPSGKSANSGASGSSSSTSTGSASKSSAPTPA
ncbi:MAG: zinc ribbon domain-containing protein [Gordonia sp. (in: high G+C Gram-positive bacteria)]